MERFFHPLPPVETSPQNYPRVPTLLAVALTVLALTAIVFSSQIRRFIQDWWRLDLVSASVKEQALQEQSKRWQVVWGLTLITAYSLKSAEEGFDDSVGRVYGLLLPLNLLAVHHDHQHWGWVNHVLQHAWTIVRILYPPSRWCLFHVATRGIWGELTIASPGVLIAHQLFTVAYSLLLMPSAQGGISLVALMFLAVFVARRWPEQKPRSWNRARCIKLASCVLNEQPGLTQTSAQSLQELVALLQNCPAPTTGNPRPFAESSASMAGGGTGTGILENCSDTEFDLQLLMRGELNSLFGPDTVEDERIPARSSIGCGAHERSHHQSCMCTPGDCCPQCSHQIRFEEGAPGYAEGPTESHQLSPDEASYTLLCFQKVHQSSTSTLHPVLKAPVHDEARAFSSELVKMSFDAMAIVNISTGEVSWANDSFLELAACAEGHVMDLRTAFLADPSAFGKCSYAAMGSGPTAVGVWSVTKPGPAGSLLWVLHRSLNPPTSVQPAASLPQGVTTPFPDASECTDPLVKVRCTSGKGRWGIQTLWRKYGSKPLLKPVDSVGPLERLYYRCHLKDCPARLRVDVVKETGERVNTTTSGTHTHHVERV